MRKRRKYLDRESANNPTDKFVHFAQNDPKLRTKMPQTGERRFVKVMETPRGTARSKAIEARKFRQEMREREQEKRATEQAQVDRLIRVINAAAGL